MAISRIRTCQRLKFSFHTSNLTGLTKIWNPAPALPFGLTTNDVTWNPFRPSALPIEVPLPHFRPTLAANDVKFSFCTSALPGLLKVWSFASTIPLCLYCQRSKVPLSVLRKISFIFRTCSARTSKYIQVHFRISSLPGLPKMLNCSIFPLPFVAGWLQGHWWGFISRNYVVWPTFFLMNVFIALKGSHFWFYIHLPHLFCQDFQI